MEIISIGFQILLLYIQIVNIANSNNKNEWNVLLIIILRDVIVVSHVIII